jgi:Flp pilus assembly protein TadB
MIPTFTLKTSPLYLAAVLILLVLFLILRNPVKKLIKSIKDSLKKKKANKIKLQNKKLKQHQNIKFIETIIHKKTYIQDWMTSILTIIGAAILLQTLVKNWVWATTKYQFLYDSLYDIFRHNNLTTILITVVLTIAILIIADVLSFLKNKKNPVLKTLHILIFSFLTAGLLIIMIQSIAYTNLSYINSIIMGALFIILSFALHHKKILKKEDEEIIEPNKEEAIKKIKEATSSSASDY